MPVNLSVKNVPASVAAALRRRAKQNHRSLQGELLAILSEAVNVRREAEASPHVRSGLTRGTIAPASESALIIRAMRDGRIKTVSDLFDELAALGGETPAESAAWIRRNRSSR